MANEVLIIIKADVKTKAAYDQAERDAKVAGDKAATAYTSAFDQRMRKLSQAISGTVQQAGQKIGEDLGTKTGEQLERKVSESVRRTRTRAKPDAEMVGQGIGQDIGDRAGEEIASRITDRVGRGTLYTSAARSSGETIGQEVGGRAGEGVTRNVRDSVRGTLYVSAARSSGEMIGQEMGDRVHSRLTERIRDAVKRRVKVDVDTDVDVDTNRTGNLAERFAGMGSQAANSFGDRFSNGLSGFFNSSALGQILAGVGITIGGIISPAIIGAVGGALTSGVLSLVGGGVLAAGIAGALKDPMFRGSDPKHPFKTGAIADLKKQYDSLLTEFGKPFRAPLAVFLEKLSGFLGSNQVKDIGKVLADTFAPVAGDLGTGLIGMLQNALPGIADAAKAAAPLFETLAKHLPEIGQRLGDFFRDISESGPDANQFFDDFLTIIEKTIGVLGKLIAGMARLYTTVRRIVTNAIEAWHDFTDATGRALDKAKEVFLEFALWVTDHVFARILIAASEALGWIPGIGPKLKVAEEKFNQFRKNVNNELNKIRDKNVTIRIRQVFTTVGQIVGDVADVIRSRMVTGGIKGAATGAISGGWTWVGERGPELAKLPPGTSVRTAGDSARMAGSSGGDRPLVLSADIDPSLEGTVIAAVLRALRLTIRNQGGNVQRVLGTAY